MNQQQHHDDIGLTGYILGAALLILLIIAGIISYKSIDWNVLKKLEAQPLNIPPMATKSAQLSPTINTPNKTIKK